MDKGRCTHTSAYSHLPTHLQAWPHGWTEGHPGWKASVGVTMRTNKQLASERLLAAAGAPAGSSFPSAFPRNFPEAAAVRDGVIPDPSQSCLSYVEGLGQNPFPSGFLPLPSSLQNSVLPSQVAAWEVHRDGEKPPWPARAYTTALRNILPPISVAIGKRIC